MKHIFLGIPTYNEAKSIFKQLNISDDVWKQFEKKYYFKEDVIPESTIKCNNLMINSQDAIVFNNFNITI